MNASMPADLIEKLDEKCKSGKDKWTDDHRRCGDGFGRFRISIIALIDSNELTDAADV